MISKYSLLLIFVLCVLLSGCFFRPCNTTLTISNNGNVSVIILIERNGKNEKIEINNNESKYFNKEMMENVYYVYIRNENIEGIFTLREYDHWFSTNHNIEIIIEDYEFNYISDGKNINSISNYEEEKWHGGNNKNKIVDFETFKEIRYNEIYDIICTSRDITRQVVSE